MRNLVKIGLTACLMFGLSGCYNEESRMIQMDVMMNWFVILAYLVPLSISLLYQFKVKNSKWYISIIIAILVHAFWVGLSLLLTVFSFSEIVNILY
jgi:hypothetical protein